MLERDLHAGKSCYPETLIVGLGNLLFRDDGAGIHIINRLKEMRFSSHVKILDGGVSSIDLLNYLEGIKRLIIIDTILTDEEPGTIHVFSLKDIIEGNDLHKFAIHQIGIIESIKIMNLLLEDIETIIVGIVPEDISGYGITLSPSVRKVIPSVLNIIEKLLSYKELPNPLSPPVS